MATCHAELKAWVYGLSTMGAYVRRLWSNGLRFGDASKRGTAVHAKLVICFHTSATGGANTILGYFRLYRCGRIERE